MLLRGSRVSVARRRRARRANVLKRTGSVSHISARRRPGRLGLTFPLWEAGRWRDDGFER